jgi:hypothetical protein
MAAPRKERKAPAAGIAEFAAGALGDLLLYLAQERPEDYPLGSRYDYQMPQFEDRGGIFMEKGPGGEWVGGIEGGTPGTKDRPYGEGQHYGTSSQVERLLEAIQRGRVKLPPMGI